jgi:ABC-type bacteriocin/lantibiotic exporter with double-glycine peptidase domain
MYTVPGMKLIRQTKTMSCWYASAQMLISWRRRARQLTEAALMDPSEDSLARQIFAADAGISNQQIIALAKNLGLREVPPQSPSESALEAWLITYGPLWVNGKSHIVVLAGIRPGEVLVYDPWPFSRGVEWRSLSGWYIGGSVDSRDISSDVSAVFLHCPN